MLFLKKIDNIELKAKKKLYQLSNDQAKLSAYRNKIKTVMFPLICNQNSLDRVDDLEEILNGSLRSIDRDLQLPDLNDGYQPSFFRKLYIDSKLSKVKHNLVKTHKKLIYLNNELENIEKQEIGYNQEI